MAFTQIFIVIDENSIHVLDDITSNTESVLKWVQIIPSKDESYISNIKLKIEMEVLLGLDPSPDLNKKLLQLDFSEYKEYIDSHSYGKTWEEKVINMFSIGIGITSLLMYLLPEESNVIRKHPGLRNLTNLSPFMRTDIVKDIIKEYRDLNVYNVLVDYCETFWDMFSSNSEEVPSPMATTEDLQRMVENTEKKVVVECVESCNCSCKTSSSSDKTSCCKTSSSCSPTEDEYSKINDFFSHMYEGMIHQVNTIIYPTIEQTKINALEAIKKSYDTVVAQLEQYKTNILDDISKTNVSTPLNITSLISTLNSQITKLNEQYTLINYRLTKLERYFEQMVPLLEKWRGN
jgi:hypothetical protein